MRHLVLIAALAACGKSASDSGVAGTRSPPTESDTDTDIDTDADADADTDTDADTDADTDTAPSGLVEAKDPGPPGYPAVIDALSIRVATGTGATDGTDDPQYVCLTEPADLATDCFKLDHGDWNDNEPGDVGEWQFTGVGLARADVTQVSLRTSDGGDRWVPTCMDLRFDGEPVYCQPLDVWIGDAGDETLAWIDPDGLHQACEACVDGPLTHGPLVGGTEPDRFRVKVRTDATRPVALRAGLSADLSDAVTVAWAYPSPADDYTAVLEARGALPDTAYHYGLVVDGTLHAPPYAPIRTAPEPATAGTYRIAIGSCAKEDDQPIFSRIQDTDPDLFLLIGDAHYANSGVLGTLRRFWRWSWERPERASLLATVPSLTIWDDHDFVENNSHGADFDAFPPEERENALKAIAEYTANPAYGTADTPGVFFRHAIGDVDLFMLDDRYHREDPDDVAEPAMLGEGQLAWLIDELTASTATFKLLVSGSTWSPESSNTGDGWESHAAEREAILDHVAATGITGVVLVSGDVHRSEIRLLAREVGYDVPELTSSNLAYSAPSACQADGGDVVVCVDSSELFMLVDLDTTAADPTLTATIVDADGAERATWSIAVSELTP